MTTPIQTHTALISPQVPDSILQQIRRQAYEGRFGGQLRLTSDDETKTYCVKQTGHVGASTFFLNKHGVSKLSCTPKVCS